MKRIPEPELMDGAEQARAYAEADFAEANELFLQYFRELHPDFSGPARVLDLGCGPGEIVLRFARTYPEAVCHALDGSEAMLQFARQAVEAAPALQSRIQLLHATLPSTLLNAVKYDIVLSNSLLHHLSDPLVLWQSLKQAGRPGAAVLVMDLMRPASTQEVDQLVETYAAEAPAILRRDFGASLFAAFTPREVQRQLVQVGLPHLHVTVVSDRHMIVKGFL